MFILNINTRDDSLMIDSTKIKRSHLLLRIKEINISKWASSLAAVM